MVESIETYAKYPFLAGARKYVESLGLSLSDISEHPIYSAAFEAGRSRVIDSLNERLSAEVGEGVELEISILSYPVARLIANLTENRSVVRKYAKGEAARAYELFRSERDVALDEVKRDLSFPVRDGSVGVMDYLALSTELAKYSPRWKLANRALDKGNVSLTEPEELLLLGESVRLRVEEPVNLKNAPKKLKAIAEKIKSAAGFSEAKITAKELSGVEFPACIKHMLSLLESGGASHNVMFILGTYFINLGLSVDEAVELFRRSPNFSEEKTRYQLEFLTGEKGGTKYSCPTCSKIKSYGLCEWDCGIKHPLHYKKKKDAAKG